MKKRIWSAYHILLSLFLCFTAVPVRAEARGAAEDPIWMELLGADGDSPQLTGQLSPLEDGRYRVRLEGTREGEAYTLVVVAGAYEQLPDIFAEELSGALLFIDMKTAAGDTLEITFKPRKQGLSSVFVTRGDGTPLLAGKIPGDPVPEDERQTCRVAFAGGGGSGTMADVDVPFGELYTLPACGFIPAGAMEVFDRWDAGAAGDVIRVYKDITLKALWKTADREEPDPEEEVDMGDGSGFKASFVDDPAVYVYTGDPIKPDVTVAFDGKTLTQGVDYTLTYSNNINASGKDKAHAVVTGKGSFSGKQVLDFEIRQKSIARGDTEGGTLPVEVPETIYLVKGTKKPRITVTYGTRILKPDNVDYYFTAPYGGFTYDTEQPINFGSKSGNFKGSCHIKVVVLDKKELKEKEIKIVMGRETHTYDGTPQTPGSLRVFAHDGAELTGREGEAYAIHYLTDNTNAGTVRFTVSGLYPYAGQATKSFKIAPRSAEPVCDISPTAVYRSAGAVPERVSVRADGRELVPGKDYKIQFAANKQVGTGKYTVSFLGNYKGTKKKTGTFTIEAASLADARIVVPDLVYGKKPGAYPSAPYVCVDGELLKKKDMEIAYLDANGNPIDKKHPIDLSAAESAVVGVSVKGKGNYTGAATAAYRVWKAGDKTIDLSRGRIVGDDGKAIPRQYYTGFEIRPGCICQVKNAGAYETVSSAKYNTFYIGNIKKGTAYIIVKPMDGSGLIGSKTAKFSIAVKKW